jgi:hypothetical protein
MPGALTERGGGVVSADLLRRAAALMRDLAQAAEGSFIEDEYGYPARYICDGDAPELAAHIASWHPAVALAVADWLDSAASAHAHFDGREISVFDLPGMDDTPALRVARAYLGET